jgi:hypothetical protein
MNFKDQQQIKKTNQWFKNHGVNVAHIYVGTAELFQATKLATATLQQCGRLLTTDQAKTLNQFLKATRNYQQRQKITQAHCYQVMNTAKQAQRLAAKQRKATK